MPQGLVKPGRRFPPPQSVRMFTEVGRVVMPHCTGKAILSMLRDQQAASLLART